MCRNHEASLQAGVTLLVSGLGSPAECTYLDFTSHRLFWVVCLLFVLFDCLFPCFVCFAVVRRDVLSVG